jgi:hypothetical protein
VNVRSLNDGSRVAFRLQWTDATHDVRATRPDEFRDAAAILFPVGEALPNICMGVAGQVTNLWHWKADWQQDIDLGYQEIPEAHPNFFKDAYPFVTGTPPFHVTTDFASPDAQRYFPAFAAGNPMVRLERASPVEELLSAGFGTATSKESQHVGGRGTWADGAWSVVFMRDLEPADRDAPRLAQGTSVPMAFAVWNGSNQEVGARKQLSSFVTLRVAAEFLLPPPNPAPPAPVAPSMREGFIILGILVLLAAVAVAAEWRGRRQPRFPA